MSYVCASKPGAAHEASPSLSSSFLRLWSGRLALFSLLFPLTDVWPSSPHLDPPIWCLVSPSHLQSLPQFLLLVAFPTTVMYLLIFEKQVYSALIILKNESPSNDTTTTAGHFTRIWFVEGTKTFYFGFMLYFTNFLTMVRPVRDAMGGFKMYSFINSS